MIEVLFTPLKNKEKKRNPKKLDLNNYFSNSEYVSFNTLINDKNIKIICLDSNNSSKIKDQWPFEFLKFTFENHHLNQRNVSLHFLKNIKFINSKNISILFSLKEYISQNFNEEDYIFLIDSNFIFLDSINKILFNRDIAISKHIIPDISVEDIIKYVSTTKKMINFYTNNINPSFDKNSFILSDFPIYIKNKVLLSIIDRWIELSIIFFNDAENPFYKNEFGYLFAFSFASLEFFKKDGNKSLNLIQISVNSNEKHIKYKYLLFNYKYPLKSYNKIRNKEIKFFYKYDYKPWTFIAENDFLLTGPQRLFYKNLCSLIEIKSGTIRPKILKV